MAIQRLNQSPVATTSMPIPVYDPSSGVDRRISINELLELLQENLSTQSDMPTKYVAPLTGENYQVTPFVEGGNVFLRVSPLGTLANFGILLPLTPYDRQEVLVKTTQTLTALGVSASVGSTTSGAPTTLAANGFFRLRYDAIFKVWDRIG